MFSVEIVELVCSADLSTPLLTPAPTKEIRTFLARIFSRFEGILTSVGKCGTMEL